MSTHLRKSLSWTVKVAELCIETACINSLHYQSCVGSSWWPAAVPAEFYLCLESVIIIWRLKLRLVELFSLFGVCKSKTCSHLPWWWCITYAWRQAAVPTVYTIVRTNCSVDIGLCSWFRRHSVITTSSQHEFHDLVVFSSLFSIAGEVSYVFHILKIDFAVEHECRRTLTTVRWRHYLCRYPHVSHRFYMQNQEGWEWKEQVHISCACSISAVDSNFV